jgi:hypothetical protein
VFIVYTVYTVYTVPQIGLGLEPGLGPGPGPEPGPALGPGPAPGPGLLIKFDFPHFLGCPPHASEAFGGPRDFGPMFSDRRSPLRDVVPYSFPSVARQMQLADVDSAQRNINCAAAAHDRAVVGNHSGEFRQIAGQIVFIDFTIRCGTNWNRIAARLVRNTYRYRGS